MDALELIIAKQHGEVYLENSEGQFIKGTTIIPAEPTCSPHPIYLSYTYEEFIEGLRPELVHWLRLITFSRCCQVFFVKFCHEGGSWYRSLRAV